MNIKYNRYRDILPCKSLDYVYLCLYVLYNVVFFSFSKDDHTRVKLKGMNDTDYINANFVECKKADRIYILAQVHTIYF